MKTNRRGIGLIFLALACTSTAHCAEKYTLHSFKKTQLSDKFFSEGHNLGDFHHDAVLDIGSGPYWYVGPHYTERHEYYKAEPFNIAGYSKNFFAFTHDVNHGGWTGIVIIGVAVEDTWWFENPQGKSETWNRHVMLKVTDGESPTFSDITGDGGPDLVWAPGGHLGY